MASRRIYVASVNRSDLILTLGAVPVVLKLKQAVEGLNGSALDCAVTRALPASVVDLTRVTIHASMKDCPKAGQGGHPCACGLRNGAGL